MSPAEGGGKIARVKPKTRRVLKLILLTSAVYVLALAITVGLGVVVMAVLGSFNLLDTGCGWLFLTLLACLIVPVVVAAHA